MIYSTLSTVSPNKSVFPRLAAAPFALVFLQPDNSNTTKAWFYWFVQRLYLGGGQIRGKIFPHF